MLFSVHPPPAHEVRVGGTVRFGSVKHKLPLERHSRYLTPPHAFPPCLLLKADARSMKRQFCHVISSMHATWGRKRNESITAETETGGEEILAVSDGISHMETVVEPFISLHCAPKLIINNAVVSPIDTACSLVLLLQRNVATT